LFGSKERKKQVWSNTDEMERKGGIKLKHMNSIAVYDDIIVVRN
jgi:hypothetical protein